MERDNHRNRITRAEIEDLSLKELRIIGRAVGVYAPTVLNREDLIRIILDVAEGRVRPVARSSRGRPHKGLPPSSELIGRILSQASEQRDFQVAEPTARFEVDSVVYSFSVRAEGLAEVFEDGTAVLHLSYFREDPEDPILPSALIEKYDLRTGDHLSVMMRKVEGDRYHSVQKILEINGHPADRQMLRPRFEQMDLATGPRYFPLAESGDPLIREIGEVCPLPRGSRACVVCEKTEGWFAPLLEALTSDGSVFRALLDGPAEEMTALNGPRTECLSSQGTTSEEDQRALTMLTARACREVESGLNVVVATDREEETPALTELWKAARDTQSGGSLTVLVLSREAVLPGATWKIALENKEGKLRLIR